MSTIKSSAEHLTLNADGASKDIKFQANGVEKASISSAGAFTSTTIDATALTGTIPNFTSTGIDDNADATAITINSSEQVGIGQTNPSYTLDVYKSAVGNVARFNSSSGNRSLDITSADNGSYLGAVWKRDINSAGGTHIWSTNGTERLRIQQAGGISFNGDTAAANALDDYEEGTWTATITTDGTDFTTSGRGTSGYYTKIGNIVIANFSVSINSPTGGTGNLILTGLPFTNTDQFAVTSAIAWGRVDLVGSFAPFGQTSGTTLEFYYPVNGAVTSNVLASHLNGNITPYFSGVVTYRTS